MPDDGRWQRVETIFHNAADLPVAERAICLDQACTGDAESRFEIESLLANDRSAELTFGEVVTQAAIDLHEDSDQEWRGRSIGLYRMTALIGKGGMGAVYRGVRDDQFRMEVAVKLLPRGSESRTPLGRFRAGRQILARLKHPNHDRPPLPGDSRTGDVLMETSGIIKIDP